MPLLTKKFDEALLYASSIHRLQKRKGTEIPYMSHLMSVAALTMEHGGSEDQAIGALLHDAAEDCGGEDRLEDIRQHFGDAVAAIVSDCTDSWEEPKPEWRPRKEAYIASLDKKPATSLLVSLADKTHNARAIVADLHVIGDELWDRFTGKRDGSLWYYDELSKFFDTKVSGPLANELNRSVKQMMDF